ncbi:MAG: DNA translocase FtsK 4TM domain-containing protein, partial [Alphaproteobacteria bacterium]|nr:DNA translocase FtsK 4TM domain-containing protein [Alphaproteobacteria bacterium]
MKKTLLPLGLMETFAHFMERLMSLGLLGIACLVATTLYYHNPLDASFNMATVRAITHPFGFLGSYTADALWQLFGVYAYGIVFFVISYSIRLWQLNRLSLFIRPLILITSLVLLGVGTASFIGIRAGTIACVITHYHAAPYLNVYTLTLIQISAIALGAGLFCFSCTIPFSWKKVYSGIQKGLSHLEHWAYVLYGIVKFGQPLVKNTAQSLWQRLDKDRDFTVKGFFSRKEKTHEEHTFDVPPPQESLSSQQSEQLSLFDQDHDDTMDDLSDNNDLLDNKEDDVTSSKAISHFKEWLKEKDKKKKPATEKRQKAPLPALLTGFDLPAVDLLDPAKASRITIDQSLLETSASELEKVLGEFGIKGEIVNIRPGPVVTMYELMPAPGIKSSRIIGLAEDIARSMCALSARIAVIPGKNVIGIELPNQSRETVYLRDLLQSDTFKKASGSLRLILGKDIGGNPSIADLARMPHLLVAGTTGSGKSVAINTMILSLLYQYTPEQCKFIMVDPKMLELSIYNDIPHLLTPVVTDPKKAVIALKWAVKEMENRYRAMSKTGVRNIDGYNARLKEAKESGEVLMRKVQTGFDPDSGKPVFETQPIDLTLLPYIVVIVDEMADLMLVAGKDIEATVQRLAQMARAAGIHLIMATQRPSVDVITGTIKANFPTRISFQVTSKIDSRTILGEQGAEQLLG